MYAATNIRDLFNVNWEHIHALALGSVLSNFKMHANIFLVPSTKPYNELLIPLGSNPITDHLMSSSDFMMMHHGAGYSRTQKALGISTWSAALVNLRV